jgi:3-oxoacyl-[acyl-carrier protein] reductase
MDLGVRGRGYLVIGGSAGMGKAAALLLAADGARVAIAGRGRDRAEAAASELSSASGVPVVALTTDLTEAGSAELVVARASEELGGLRGLAVTTGLGVRGQRDLLSGTDEDWIATFNDVLMGTVPAAPQCPC